jgi:hypothetical protein
MNKIKVLVVCIFILNVGLSMASEKLKENCEDFRPGCWVFIFQKSTVGDVIDGKSSSSDVYLNGFNATDYQLWKFEKIVNTDGYFKIVHKASGRVLDGEVSGSSVYLNTWNGGPTQQWKFEKYVDGWYKIIHKATGRVIDSKGHQSEVYLLKSNDGDHQRWKILINVDAPKD